jgi:hypothetical protein
VTICQLLSDDDLWRLLTYSPLDKAPVDFAPRVVAHVLSDGRNNKHCGEVPIMAQLHDKKHLETGQQCQYIPL